MISDSGREEGGSTRDGQKIQGSSGDGLIRLEESHDRLGWNVQRGHWLEGRLTWLLDG